MLAKAVASWDQPRPKAEGEDLRVKIQRGISMT